MCKKMRMKKIASLFASELVFFFASLKPSFFLSFYLSFFSFWFIIVENREMMDIDIDRKSGNKMYTK